MSEQTQTVEELVESIRNGENPLDDPAKKETAKTPKAKVEKPKTQKVDDYPTDETLVKRIDEIAERLQKVEAVIFWENK